MSGILGGYNQGDTVAVVQNINGSEYVVTPQVGSGGAVLVFEPANTSGATVILAEWEYQPGAGPGGADQATVVFQGTGEDVMYWVAADIGWQGYTRPLLLLPGHQSTFTLTDVGQGYLTMQVDSPPSWVQTAFQSQQFYPAFGFQSAGPGTAGKYGLAATG
jgi:hypothetical protein